MERIHRCSGERGATDPDLNLDLDPSHQTQRGRNHPSGYCRRCSLDDFFASFAYKSPKQRQQRQQQVGSNRSCPNPSQSKPSPIQNYPKSTKPPNTTWKRNRRSSSSSSFVPSSFVRVIVDGEKRIVSSYFPLPQNASQPEVIDRRDLQRILSKRPKGDEEVLLSTNTNTNRNTNRNRKKKQQQQNQNKIAAASGGDKPKIKKRRKQRSLLSSEEKKLDAYRRVGEESVWEASKSDFNLLQERHCFDPWRVLVICMLLNLTTGRQVKRVLPGLFLRCPNAEAATKIPEEELTEVIKPLGLYRKRAKAIIRFSCEYLGSEWTHVTQLPGVGKYAADAYAIFCAGKPEDVIPEDHKLVDYWKFVCEKRAQEQQLSTFEFTEVEDDAGSFL